MKIVNSIQKVERKFNTGDEPLLVDCNDGIKRICKYNRNPYSSANKLVCELVGAYFIEKWGLNAPGFDFVSIKPNHIPEGSLKMSFDSPCFGTRLIENTYDINFNNYFNIPRTEQNFYQLLKIALFDFWVSNEDRSANNTNLLFDFSRNLIIPIDNGGIFNTINLDYEIQLLDPLDSILSADIFNHLKTDFDESVLFDFYRQSVLESQKIQLQILDTIPSEWNVRNDAIKNKFSELFSENWINGVWDQFINTLNGLL